MPDKKTRWDNKCDDEYSGQIPARRNLIESGENKGKYGSKYYTGKQITSYFTSKIQLIFYLFSFIIYQLYHIRVIFTDEIHYACV